ncbi:hypothetical protein HCJ76_06735 [Streptomyces sp. MC1]|uniref:hypothetical protein n=1 Tax=Streptomyces sp. MC1 TaxID=295105 RepID=UPI0018C9E0BF|nr:hypothetical protein [Streptomyces sp. MC1]
MPDVLDALRLDVAETTAAQVRVVEDLIGMGRWKAATATRKRGLGAVEPTAARGTPAQARQGIPLRRAGHTWGEPDAATARVTGRYGTA